MAAPANGLKLQKYKENFIFTKSLYLCTGI